MRRINWKRIPLIGVLQFAITVILPKVRDNNFVIQLLSRSFDTLIGLKRILI
jgi:hypothetical protein